VSRGGRRAFVKVDPRLVLLQPLLCNSEIFFSSFCSASFHCAPLIDFLAFDLFLPRPSSTDATPFRAGASSQGRASCKMASRRVPEAASAHLVRLRTRGGGLLARVRVDGHSRLAQLAAPARVASEGRKRGCARTQRRRTRPSRPRTNLRGNVPPKNRVAQLFPRYREWERNFCSPRRQLSRGEVDPLRELSQFNYGEVNYVSSPNDEISTRFLFFPPQPSKCIGVAVENNAAERPRQEL